MSGSDCSSESSGTGLEIVLASEARKRSEDEKVVLELFVRRKGMSCGLSASLKRFWWFLMLVAKPTEANRLWRVMDLYIDTDQVPSGSVGKFPYALAMFCLVQFP